jgi:hypothetical protein
MILLKEKQSFFHPCEKGYFAPRYILHTLKPLRQAVFFLKVNSILSSQQSAANINGFLT